MSDSLILSREGRVVTLTINRPPLNILDLQTIIEMDRVLEKFRSYGKQA